ncbi:MAG: hypothetical protein KC729_04700 [Candidatus Eisenbacteria bacterium]|uniref:Uncharacterized protein n=1 Tax=Eiseniibacteriota bacterium TaxID=2212470 RepID=A0A956LWF9_UNCEI|nr:hypothetical protein [Candidatus Eisenbacteria bacterium]
MNFKKTLLVGISMVALAGFVVVAANAGSGKSCSASADKASCTSTTSTTTAAKTTDGTVQNVSNTGSCASQAANASGTSCSAVHAAAAGSCTSTTASAGSCTGAATMQTISNTGSSCCAGKVEGASASSCTAAHTMQTASNTGGSCCAGKVQGASASCSGSCSAGMKTASNASCSSANPSECMNAWLPKGMNFIRLDVPGGVDFVFTGQGVDKLSKACSYSCSNVAAAKGSRFALAEGNGYVVLSVRGEDAASCCGEVVEMAFATSGAGGPQG